MNKGKATLAEGFVGEERPAFADPMNKYYGGTISRNPKWRPTVNDPVPRGVCEYVRRDGTRCEHLAVPGTGNEPTDKLMCQWHGGRLPNVAAKAERVRAAAANMLLDNVESAISHLTTTMANTSAPDAVRLKAATEILDRAGIKQAHEVNVTVEDRRPPSEVLSEKINALRNGSLPQPEIVVDAEVEEDDV